MKVFLTGGTGTIGRAVLARLVARGHRVTALARSPEAGARLRAAGAHAWSGDLRAPREWLDQALGSECFVHLANSFDAEGRAAERRLVAALIAARQGATPFHLVYTGGIWLYPPTRGMPLREATPFAPLPAFAHVANAIRSLAAARHLALSVIHPALVCSPDGGPVADMRKAAESGRPFVTRAARETLWPLVDADDLADLYVRAVEARSYRLTAVGCGIEATSVGTLMDLVRENLGLRLDLAHDEPPPDLAADLDVSAGYARSQVASGDGARRLLDWSPQITTPQGLVEHTLPLAV
jgi:nucleoside-diphosphate-sugar epimerase